MSDRKLWKKFKNNGDTFNLQVNYRGYNHVQTFFWLVILLFGYKFSYNTIKLKIKQAVLELKQIVCFFIKYFCTNKKNIKL